VAITILNQMGDGVAATVRERHPDVTVVGVTGDAPPAGLQADVFFGGYGDWATTLPWLQAAGVRWVQLSGTGADRVPSARSASVSGAGSALRSASWVSAIGRQVCRSPRPAHAWGDSLDRHADAGRERHCDSRRRVLPGLVTSG